MSMSFSIAFLLGCSVLLAKRFASLIFVSIVLCLSIIFFIVSMERHYYLPLHLEDAGLINYTEVSLSVFLAAVKAARRARPSGKLSIEVYVYRFVYLEPFRVYCLRHYPQSFNISYKFND